MSSSMNIVALIRDIAPNAPHPRLEIFFPEEARRHLPVGKKEPLSLIIEGTAWRGTINSVAPGNPPYLHTRLHSPVSTTKCTQLLMDLNLAEGARLSMEVVRVDELRLQEVLDAGRWRPGRFAGERHTGVPTASSPPEAEERVDGTRPQPQKVHGISQQPPLRPSEAARTRSLRIDSTVAERAIRAYNADPTVLGQEHRAFESLGLGFRGGEVAAQLRALDANYSTRSVATDLEVIGRNIEEVWAPWSTAAGAAPRIEDSVIEIDSLRFLLGPFIGSATRRKPRSLATKALHFTAPGAFIPADKYAVDTLDRELDSGSWARTSGLDTTGMARWYHDYLSLIHQIGQANRPLIEELLRIDAETFRLPHTHRIRGLPKLLDKILWWIGQEAKRGRPLWLFKESGAEVERD